MDPNQNTIWIRINQYNTSSGPVIIKQTDEMSHRQENQLKAVFIKYTLNHGSVNRRQNGDESKELTRERGGGDQH